MSIHVVKSEYNGHVEYHLRYPGMTKERAQALADQINADHRLADVYKSMLGAQQHHAELCRSVYEAAVKAKLIHGIGACGGGLPTFDAIISKCLEAIAAVGTVEDEVIKLTAGPVP